MPGNALDTLVAFGTGISFSTTVASSTFLAAVAFQALRTSRTNWSSNSLVALSARITFVAFRTIYTIGAVGARRALCTGVTF